MRFSRRHFFGASVAAYVTTSMTAAASQKTAPAVLSESEFAAFTAFVDTLIPADRHSPAASELDVPRRMIETNRRQPVYLKLVRLGCRWLDRRAKAIGRTTFSALDDRRREMIVEQAARLTAKGLPNAFFRVVRHNAMVLYYSTAESWPALGYDGPPQPDGFMDYRQPPKMRTR